MLPDRFINWRPHDGTKVPCRPDGTICDAHDPGVWLSEAEARQSNYPIAFVLNGDGWFFLDMDNCREGEGWSHAATAIWQSFNGAMGEISQSGNGLHIMGKCDPGALSDRRNKWEGWLEFYTDKRFVAFGPHGWTPIGGTWRDVDWTHQLLRFVPQREHLGELPEGRDPTYTGPEDDEDLVRLMLGAHGGASSSFGGVSLSDLWNGAEDALRARWPSETDAFDHSSADMALMSHLAFWTGRDMPRMDRLFRRSALMRDKYAQREDYRRDTIQKAARLCKSVYDRQPVTAQKTTGGVKEVWLTAQEMIEHFKGCVYVRDIHRVLVPDGALLKPEQFNATYGGHVFQMMPDGTKPSTEAFKAFTQCAVHAFPKAKGTTFRPDMKPSQIIGDNVNVYVKPNVPIEPGDITRFEDFLRRLLPDERDRTILLSWCAACVQNPGAKFQWAPVLQGAEGNGKSLLASCMSYVLGDAYTYEPRASQLQNQFISFDENRLLIIVEEVHMGGRREMLDELKTRITNQRIEVEVKGQDRRMIRNTANWFFCTNHQDAVIKSRNDRRYAIFFTAQQSAEDVLRDGMGERYFPGLYEWLRTGGGYSHVGHYLLNYRIPDEFNPVTMCHRAPKTSSTEAAIERTMGNVESEILEAVESEQPGFRGGWISSHALDLLLRDRGMRIGRSKRGDILREMGYQPVGRASSPIFREGGQRPNLWRMGGGKMDVDAYLNAQGPGYA